MGPGAQLPGKQDTDPGATRAPDALLGCKPAAAIPDEPVHRLPEQVDMGVVAGVLLDHVDQDSSQLGVRPSGQVRRASRSSPPPASAPRPASGSRPVSGDGEVDDLVLLAREETP